MDWFNTNGKMPEDTNICLVDNGDFPKIFMACIGEDDAGSYAQWQDIETGYCWDIEANEVWCLCPRANDVP